MSIDKFSGLRVLCVEDDPDIRAIAELALGDVGGFDVKLCASGTEALSVVDDFQPELVLLDVMMPGMDGPETLRALRACESLQSTPVIFMTARLQPDEIKEYLELGAIDVIPKPFDPMTLGEQIGGILDRHSGTTGYR